jgi:hypothetical protein
MLEADKFGCQGKNEQAENMHGQALRTDEAVCGRVPHVKQACDHRSIRICLSSITDRIGLSQKSK